MTEAAEAEDTVQLGELTQSLGFLLRIAQVQVFDLFYLQLAKHGLKPGEFTVPWVVGENPGLRQGAVARKLRIKPAHMTKLVQRMVSAGLMTRTVPEDDRRSVRLNLTAEGRTFLDGHRSIFLDFHKTERARLTPAESAQLLALLGKLTGIGEEDQC